MRTFGKLRMLSVLALAAGLATISTSSAFAAGDVTPPTLTVDARPSFVVGSTIGPSIDYDRYLEDPDGLLNPNDLYTYDIQQYLQWSGFDADSGVASYQLQKLFWGGEGSVFFGPTLDTSFLGEINNYNGDFGGGAGVVSHWLLTAKDQEHNATTRALPFRPQVTQEDGNSLGEGSFGTVSFTGPWAETNCACFSGEHTRRTSAAGATVTFSSPFVEGQHVAVVMAKGPGRGRARILIDGVRVAAVNTFATSNTNRVVVFEQALTEGTHTVIVRNLATPGHRRIDIDAFMTN
jgi:hypothetical protein